MFRRLFSRTPLEERAAAMRAAHERWLSAAVSSSRPPPRIPMMRVDHGGFSEVMASPFGRAWAAEWWALAFSCQDPFE